MLQERVDCSWRLPEALVSYLGRLAGESDEAEQTFVLSVRHTGVGDVQDILIRRGHVSSWRTVFGYPPVEATIIAHRREEGLWLELAYGEERHMARAGKGASPCYA